MPFLVISQVVLSLIIISLVLMQSQGGGLGSAFGGLATYHTKRGLEKSLFIATIAAAVLFTLVSLALVIV